MLCALNKQNTKGYKKTFKGDEYLQYHDMGVCICPCILSHFSHVWLCANLWTVGCQAPLSMRLLQARVLEWVAMLSSRDSS